MKKRILWIFSHPNREHSHVNIHIMQQVKKLDFVTVRDLYEIYPDFWIDVPAEQDLISQHQMIVFQHPFQWYSMPPLLKMWVDEVFLFNYAYGPEGKALRSKDFLLVVSTGGSEDAYTKDGYNHFKITEFLPSYKQTASLCGMRWCDPFILFGAHHKKEADVAKHSKKIVEFLQAYIKQ